MEALRERLACFAEKWRWFLHEPAMVGEVFACEVMALSPEPEARQPVEALRERLKETQAFLDVEVRAMLPNEHGNCPIASGCAHGAFEAENFAKLDHAVFGIAAALSEPEARQPEAARPPEPGEAPTGAPTGVELREVLDALVKNVRMLAPNSLLVGADFAELCWCREKGRDRLRFNDSDFHDIACFGTHRAIIRATPERSEAPE